MKMEGGWEDRLHFAYLGEHVLFHSLQLNSFSRFLLASLLTVFICLTERLLTFALSKHWSPFSSTRRSRLRTALWRSTLYWLVTFDRLLYMLIAMTFHVGILIVTVTALSVGQFMIEYLETSTPLPRDSYRVKEPLLNPPRFVSSTLALETMENRPRSKSKPESIFIHPNQSNIARADAVAVEMGLSGDTDFVKGNAYPEEDDAWELGKGREVARALLSGTARQSAEQSHQQESERQRLFEIGEEDSDDEERDFS